MTVVACDSSARSDEAPLEKRPPGESRAYETCGTTSHCADGLRCIDQSCQRDERSRLGDYYAAAGRRLLELGEPAEAAQAFNEAVTQYEKEEMSPPIDLLCEQGGALVQAREDTQLGEAAARILHKCVLDLPLSSRLARQAMDDLATLAEVGLDPELLARSETADLYLTLEGEDRKPDSLRLQVTGDGKSKRRSYSALVAALQTPAALAAFTGCWDGYWKATEKEQLSVTLPFAYRLVWHEDDASKDRAVLKLETPTPPTDPALATASQCVVTAAGTIATEAAKSMREDTRWKARITIQIGS